MTALEPGQLWVMRVRALAAALVIAVAAAIAGQALHDELGLPRAIAAAALVAAACLHGADPARPRLTAPGAMRSIAAELQVRHGVWTRIQTFVPLDRVQHIDISQGPLERSFAVCRLVLHTAGTMHSLVVLPGLARATAERMRDEIRARIAQARNPE